MLLSEALGYIVSSFAFDGNDVGSLLGIILKFCDGLFVRYIVGIDVGLMVGACDNLV